MPNSEQESAVYYEKPPENTNPGSIRPLSFGYSHPRRKYIRSYTEIDHSSNPDWDWPWVLRMDPRTEGVVP